MLAEKKLMAYEYYCSNYLVSLILEKVQVFSKKYKDTHDKVTRHFLSVPIIVILIN